MNVFGKMKTNAIEWQVKKERNFDAAEIAAVKSAEVAPSQYGNSVCFIMNNGCMTFIPLSNDSTIGVGESVDLTKAKLVILCKDGEADIMRVKA
jgi:hypothetical protein